MPYGYLALLLAANLTLLLPPASPVRVAGALLLLGLLPGLSWARRWLAHFPHLARWTTAAALSYSFTGLATLLLSYLPGPVQVWQLLLALNLLAILPLLPPPARGEKRLSSSPPVSPPFLVILLVALLLRGLNLDYSEFQGDEALAMIAAAEALEGHEDALFLRSKGPAEALLPMAMWRLAGAITEATARLPFTAAALLAIVTIHLIGQKIGGPRAGWLAAGFFGFNGFMVAFGRIVQYQALVIWFSALAFWLALEWRDAGQLRYALLAGLCLGLGLLAHYDAVLVIPTIIWLLATGPITKTTGERSGRSLPVEPEAGAAAQADMAQPGRQPAASSRIRPLLGFGLAVLLVALPFYLPFSLDPQANRIGDYLGGRIGTELRNNLPDFFHFNIFYSSAYYLIVAGLLALGLLVWLLWQTQWGRWLSVVAVAGVLAVTLNPLLLAGNGLDFSLLPFALLLIGPFLAALLNKQTPSPLLPLILWLAIPFLGYNFVVALGLTHIYTTVPAWSLLAGLGWYLFFDAVSGQGDRRVAEISPLPPCSPAPLLRIPRLISNGLLVALALLSTLFLWNAFIRHDVEYWQDYPAGNLPLYWQPYDQPPRAGFFGFAHRAGWKAIGQKIVTGELRGDYGSNEEPDVTTWYTRGAPRACDPQPEFYFLADDLIDPVETPAGVITSGYDQIGQVTLPNQKQMRIMQLQPVTLALGELDEAGLAGDFDRTATPAAFARSGRGSTPVEANFDHLIRLIGYDLDARRAYPGGRVAVVLYWQAVAPIPASYQVFTHLEGASGPVAQADGAPVCWSYPTDRWRPGQIIADPHAIYLSPAIPPGDYPLQVGLYLADTFERLNVLDPAGNPAGTSVTLTGVNIAAND